MVRGQTRLQCQHCGTTFTAELRSAKFCRRQCKAAHNNAIKRQKKRVRRENPPNPND